MWSSYWRGSSCHARACVCCEATCLWREAGWDGLRLFRWLVLSRWQRGCANCFCTRATLLHLRPFSVSSSFSSISDSTRAWTCIRICQILARQVVLPKTELERYPFADVDDSLFVYIPRSKNSRENWKIKCNNSIYFSTKTFEQELTSYSWRNVIFSHRFEIHFPKVFKKWVKSLSKPSIGTALALESPAISYSCYPRYILSLVNEDASCCGQTFASTRRIICSAISTIGIAIVRTRREYVDVLLYVLIRVHNTNAQSHVYFCSQCWKIRIISLRERTNC